MKYTPLVALGLVLMSPEIKVKADTAQLIQWQSADAPVVLAEEAIDPAFSPEGSADKSNLVLRILASNCLIREGTLLLLNTVDIHPATQDRARRWLLNMDKLEGLRSLHARGEVLHATAPAGSMDTPASMQGFNWNQRTSWAQIHRFANEGISAEEVQRAAIICRESFTPRVQRYQKNNKWYEKHTLVCEMALPESWCKGYQPGERIIIHYPEVEIAGEKAPQNNPPQGYNGAFLLTDQFERRGNTLHLRHENCRCVIGHKGNTDKISALLAQENAPTVPLQITEYSPYMPDDEAARNATPLERACHFIYNGLQINDTVLRCRYISRQIIDYDTKNQQLASLYKCEYNVAEVLECLKGTWKPGTQLSFWRQTEGCKLAPGTYTAEGEFFLGFHEQKAVWLPTEKVRYLGEYDFQFMRIRATELNDSAMQKVMTDYPELYGRTRPTPQIQHPDTEQLREIALQAIRERYGKTGIPYCVQGYGTYVLVHPAPGHQDQGPHVLLRQDGTLARIYTPDTLESE